MYDIEAWGWTLASSKYPGSRRAMSSASLGFSGDAPLGAGGAETDGLVLGPQLAVSQNDTMVSTTCRQVETTAQHLRASTTIQIPCGHPASLGCLLKERRRKIYVLDRKAKVALTPHGCCFPRGAQVVAMDTTGTHLISWSNTGYFESGTAGSYSFTGLTNMTNGSSIGNFDSFVILDDLPRIYVRNVHVIERVVHIAAVLFAC